MNNLIIVGFMSFLSVSCSLFGIGSEEQPKYEVIFKSNNKEIRKYAPYIVAKTTVEGSFEEAQSRGFKILAGYIFGKNKSKKSISMTSPVIQKSDSENEKISMTSPVIIKSDKNQKSWTMSFSMPSKFTLESLPIPNDERVKLEKVDSRFVAALRFTGFWNKDKNEEKASELISWLEKNKKFIINSKPMFAGYNPPWTIPIFRRNEILIELEEININN